MKKREKELPWFKFSPVKWALGKISRQPESAQIAFLRLCGKYWTEKCRMSAEQAQDECGEEVFKSLAKSKILKMENDIIHISFLDEQLREQLSISQTRSETGKKGGLAKATKSQAKAKQKLPIGKQNVAEEKRREEREKKENNTPIIPLFDEFLAHAQEKKPGVDEQAVRLKYEAWKEYGWKTGKGEVIKNWKAVLNNTLAHISMAKGRSVNPGNTNQVVAL